MDLQKLCRAFLRFDNFAKVAMETSQEVGLVKWLTTIARLDSVAPLSSHFRTAFATKEDCGGIPGFYRFLEAPTDPKRPDHADA